MGGVHSVPNRSEPGRLPARGGRPESETDTPVNIENGLYRDNGEGVAATPLPYPLDGDRQNKTAATCGMEILAWRGRKAWLWKRFLMTPRWGKSEILAEF